MARIAQPESAAGVVHGASPHVQDCKCRIMVNTGKHSRRRTPSAPVLVIRRSYASCSTVARERTPHSTKGARIRLHKRQGRGGRPRNIRRSGAHRMHSSGRQAMLAMLPPFCHTPCRRERLRFFNASIKIVCARTRRVHATLNLVLNLVQLY